MVVVAIVAEPGGWSMLEAEAGDMCDSGAVFATHHLTSVATDNTFVLPVNIFFLDSFLNSASSG